jgi:hypothetical protein
LLKARVHWQNVGDSDRLADSYEKTMYLPCIPWAAQHKLEGLFRFRVAETVVRFSPPREKLKISNK